MCVCVCVYVCVCVSVCLCLFSIHTSFSHLIFTPSVHTSHDSHLLSGHLGAGGPALRGLTPPIHTPSHLPFAPVFTPPIHTSHSHLPLGSSFLSVT